MAVTPRRNSDSYYRRLPLLKKLFWAYFLLLIFEGAVRKWVVPQLSAPLLVIRDPVAIMIIWEAYRTKRFPPRWTTIVAALTILLVGISVIQIVIGGNPLLVAVFGLRSYLLPFPVLFIMGDNLDDEDLRKLGSFTLFTLLPMSLLALSQYLAPGTALVNAGAYEGANQITYVDQHVRSSGTFSFAIGVVHFCTLASAFILYGLVRSAFVKSWMLWTGAAAALLIIPTTGARTVLAELGAMFVCVAIGAAMGLSQFGRVLRMGALLLVVSFLVAQLPVFSEAMQSMTDRITGANTSEGGDAQSALIYRTVGPAFNTMSEQLFSGNWVGMGIGSESSAMQALFGASVWSDNQLEREFLEMGPVAGMGYLLFKIVLAITLFSQALARAREEEPLALLMLPLVFSTLFFGNPEQPTVQGFMVISGAICIAASRPLLPSVDPMLRKFRYEQLLYGRRVPSRVAWRQR